MVQTVQMQVIGHVKSGFSSKFGIPRQSGLSDELRAQIVFAPEFRDAAAFRGLEAYSHLWILWQFSEALRDAWSPTVRPPRLGGNRRVGVFATRSPYRPNAIGLSCVRLVRVQQDEILGPVLEIAGADILDGTPVFDVKPYLAYADARPEAKGGFSVPFDEPRLEVNFPEELLEVLPREHRAAVIELLRQDPRPAYQNAPQRRYGMEYAGYDVRFFVSDNVLRVVEVVPLKGEKGL